MFAVHAAEVLLVFHIDGVNQQGVVTVAVDIVHLQRIDRVVVGSLCDKDIGGLFLAFVAQHHVIARESLGFDGLVEGHRQFVPHIGGNGVTLRNGLYALHLTTVERGGLKLNLE